MEYRIQRRKGSSDIIEICSNPREKGHKWVPFIAPLITKKEGDRLAEELLVFLNAKTE